MFHINPTNEQLKWQNINFIKGGSIEVHTIKDIMERKSFDDRRNKKKQYDKKRKKEEETTTVHIQRIMEKKTKYKEATRSSRLHKDDYKPIRFK